MSNPFTKTLIVDPDITLGGTYPSPPYFNTIKDATDDLSGTGGTIIVEQGTYTIASSSDTITIPSNVTIIGRGNAVIQVTDPDISAFKNADWTGGNDRIRIEGFKIEVNQSRVALTRPVGHPLPQVGEGGISNLCN